MQTFPEALNQVCELRKMNLGRECVCAQSRTDGSAFPVDCGVSIMLKRIVETILGVHDVTFMPSRQGKRIACVIAELMVEAAREDIK